MSKACPLFLVFPGTSSTPLLPPSSAGSRDHAPSSNRFRIAAYLDPLVGLQRTWERDSLEPRANWEPSVEGQPDEGSHFARTGIMPDPNKDLGGRGVPEFQPLDEFHNPKGLVRFSCVLIAPLGGVSEERSVPHVVRLLPVPVSRVPLEVGDKSESEDPVEKGFLTWEGEVLGQFEGCTMVVLSEYPDRFVPLQGDGDGVGAGGLDVTRVGDPPEF